MNVRRALEAAAIRIGTMRTPDLLRALSWEFDNLSQAFWLLAKHAQVVGRAAVLAWAATMEPWKLAEHVLEAAMLPEGVQGTVTIYVSSVAGDGTDGLTWAKAELSVAAGLAGATDAAFNFVYVDSAHTFTPGAAITWNGTTGAATAIISVDRNGSTTTGHNGWLAGAAESVGAFNGAIVLCNTAHKMWVSGVTLTGGTGASSGADIMLQGGAASGIGGLTVVNCIFTLPATNTGAQLQFGAGDNNGGYNVRLENCTVNIVNAASTAPIVLQGERIELIGLTIGYAGATKPTVLFTASTVRIFVDIIDSDLSGFDTTGGNYFSVAGMDGGYINVVNCKLSSTPGLITGTWPTNSFSITLINVDSGDTHNVFEYRNRLGTITENSTNFANSGAQFNAAGISWEIVTTALCTEMEPFVTPWIHRWLDTTGSQDLHLQLLRDSATDFTNLQVWGEFDCMESSTFPNGTLTSTRNAQPFDGTPADLTNSAKTWTETLTNDNEMEVRVTRTVAEKCLARGRLYVGVASTTLYLDPSLWIGT